MIFAVLWTFCNEFLPVGLFCNAVLLLGWMYCEDPL